MGSDDLADDGRKPASELGGRVGAVLLRYDV
jgi:hypothetical protein